MKWVCTQKYFDNGKVIVSVTPASPTMQAGYSEEHPDYDLYVDIFASEKEAEEWAEDARNA